VGVWGTWGPSPHTQRHRGTPTNCTNSPPLGNQKQIKSGFRALASFFRFPSPALRREKTKCGKGGWGEMVTVVGVGEETRGEARGRTEEGERIEGERRGE